MLPQTPKKTADTEKQKRALFQRKIDAGQKIEPNEWMPSEYREMLAYQLTQKIYTETIGMQPESCWVARTPTLQRKVILLAKIQDEGGHGLYLHGVAETANIPREKITADLHSGKNPYSCLLDYFIQTWGDIGAIGWLIDGAAICIQVSLQRTSYGPYARSMIRICKEENFHQRQGYQIMIALARGSAEQRKMAQDSLNRWYWPALMIFGLPDDQASHLKDSMKYKLQLYSNDTLRQKFIDQTVPQIEYLGLEHPDKNIKWNEERQHYDSGDIDWNKLSSIVKAHSSCHARPRLQHHRKVHAEGSWVREAQHAYRQKQIQRKLNAAA